MNELILFVIQFVVAYLLLGCVLVGFISLSLHLAALNAAARHRVWLIALLVLVIAPFLSIFPERDTDPPSGVLSGQDSSFHNSAVKSRASNAAESRTVMPQEFIVDSSGSGALSGYKYRLSIVALLPDALSQSIVKVSFARELAASLGALMLLGILIKFFGYIRSLIALRKLVCSSELVQGEWADVLDRNLVAMKMRKRIELRKSNKLNTPSTCGVIKPCIILPAKMAINDGLLEFRAQILQHELAHIKRNDPLVAGFQAVVSIFLFWHPAVSYINSKIRYEREVACDDWVVSSRQNDSAAVKAYAYGIVRIAESLSKQTALVHSVACVNNSSGLQKRIRNLLDRRTDHSTSVDLMPNVWVAALALGFMLLSSTLLPKFPLVIFQKSVESETVRDQTLDSTAVKIFRKPKSPGLQVGLKVPKAEPIVQQVVSYEAPLPVPELDMNQRGGGASAVHSRALRIESEFSSNVATLAKEGDLAIEAIKLISYEVDPAQLDEFIYSGASTPRSKHAVASSDSDQGGFVNIDKLSRLELAREISKIELELYRVFNAVTDRDDLKIYCDTQPVLGSYIKQTVCEPEFVRAARSENLRSAIGSAGMHNHYTSLGVQENMEAEYAELASEILAEMKSNRYLLELYQVLAGLRERLVELA